MAPDNSKYKDKDQTAWPGLNDQANAGHLEFEPGAAEQGAQAAAQLVADLLYYQGMIDGHLTNIGPIGDLTSGGLVATNLNLVGTHMSDALTTHIAILRDMIDTFNQAGRNYVNTDHMSADNLRYLHTQSPADDSQSTFKVSGDHQFKVPNKTSPNSYDDSADDGYPDSLKNYKGGKAPFDVRPEPKDSMSWEALYHLGQDMKPDPYNNAYELYKLLKTKVDSSLSDFNNSIQALQSKWRGDGATAAQGAVTSYCNSIQPLLDTMDNASQLMRYTSRWMIQTAATMPYQEHQPWSCDKHGVLERYRGHYQDHYADGVTHTSQSTPSVPVPAPVVKPKPADNGGKDNGGKDNGGKDNGGKDNGGKDNGGKDNGGKDNGGKDNGGANNGGANSGGASGGSGSGGGSGSQYKQPNIPPLKNTSDPNGTNPNGTNPNGTNPNGTNPYGSNPSGTNQTYPNQSQPQTGSAGSSSGGSDMSQLTSVLSSLMSGVTTGISTVAQQLPSILQALESMHSTDLSTLATALGVPEDKLTTAFTAIEQDPSKVTQLSQLLGLSGTTPQTPTPMAGMPGDTTLMGGVTMPNAVLANAIPAAAVANSPLAGLTNLFGGGEVPGAAPDPLVGIVAAPSDGAAPNTTEVPAVAADPALEQVDFIRGFGQTFEGVAGGNPVVEA